MGTQYYRSMEGVQGMPTVYYIGLLQIITFCMQIIVFQRHMKRLESEMPQEEFADLNRKILSHLEARFGERRSLQVQQYFNL